MSHCGFWTIKIGFFITDLLSRIKQSAFVCFFVRSAISLFCIDEFGFRVQLNCSITTIAGWMRFNRRVAPTARPARDCGNYITAYYPLYSSPEKPMPAHHVARVPLIASNSVNNWHKRSVRFLELSTMQLEQLKANLIALLRTILRTILCEQFQAANFVCVALWTSCSLNQPSNCLITWLK